LKAALLNRDFEQAQLLIAQWGKHVSAEIKSASSDGERRRILEEARLFAESSIYLTRVVRAHIATELQANSASFLYLDVEPEQHGWHVRA